MGCSGNLTQGVPHRYDGGMPKELSVEEAVDRARAAQDARVEAVRSLAIVRQALVDERTAAAERVAELERQNADAIGAAEREDAKAFASAVKAGWSEEELKKIGFPEPEKQARAKRRRATKSEA